MKKILSVIIVMVLCSLTIVGCGKKTVMNAEGYAKELGKADLSIEKLEVYTSETDPNKLLGRPNQYTSKVNFEKGSIEVFNNETDVKNRKKYIDEIGKVTPLAAEYSYINGNALLRVKKDLTPEQAKKYEDAFMKLK